MKVRDKAVKGFTLVEIMIVVVIIGLLAAMAIPAFNVVRARSQDKTVTNNLRQIASASEQYFIDQGASAVVVANLVGAGTDKYISTLNQVADETYVFTIATGNTRLVTQVNGRIVSYEY